MFDAFAVFAQIKRHCDTGTPFSLIRLGDGEGALLGYPKLSTRSDVRRSEQVWFGKSLWSDEELYAIVAILSCRHPQTATIRAFVSPSSSKKSMVGIDF